MLRALALVMVRPMSSQTHGFPKENAMCPPCGDTQTGVTGGSGAEDGRGTHRVAGAGLAAEFLPPQTSPDASGYSLAETPLGRDITRSDAWARMRAVVFEGLSDG